MAHYYFVRSYWFTENAIISVQVVSPVYFFVLFVTMLVTVNLATGTLGGFIEGLAAGIGSWLVLAFVSSRARGRLTKLPLEALAARNGAVRIPLSQVDRFRLRGKTVSFSIHGKVHKAKIAAPQREGFLALIASRESQATPTETPERDESAFSIVRKASALLLLGLTVFGGALWLTSNYFLFQIPTSQAFSFATSQAGFLLFLDAPGVYGIWKPSFMTPVPRWVASVGLFIGNLTTVGSIAAGGLLGPVLPIQSVGVVLMTVVATLVPLRLAQSRYHGRDPSEL
ncbi:MAG: hypothetical protein JRN21_02490 [Nitrososphaerota archaeon]|nr:hypothetical protein [Nitrososphaerota archaeon]